MTDRAESEGQGVKDQNPYRHDVAANRAARKWSRKELAGRLLWDVAHPLFALSPRPMWAWRRWLLRLFGARIGRDVQIHPTARITIPWNLTIGDGAGIGDRVILYALGPIQIGAKTAVSQGAHICAGTHDYRDPALRLIKSPITVGREVWVCADAFLCPGVDIGDYSVVAARAVVTRDVPSGVLVAGNPARVIKERPRDTT